MPITPEQFESYRYYLESLFSQKVSDRKITAITVNPPYHGQAQRIIAVGKICAELEPGAPGEEILAIYESKSFLVVTANHGAGLGMPYIFPRPTVRNVQYNEPKDAD